MTGIHLLCPLFFGLSLVASAGEGAIGPAAQASPRLVEFDWMSLSAWRERHARLVDVAERGDADLVFLGDSITEGWTWGDTPAVFQAAFGKYKTANFGIGGDQTQHVLWRLQNGEAGNLSPKLTVLLVGTNNFGHSGHSPEQVREGVQAIIHAINKHWPASRILLLGILPCGEEEGDPNRARVARANQLLAALGDDWKVEYRDFGPLFVDERGTIPAELMADFLHPTTGGYRLLAEKLGPVVDRLMGAGDADAMRTAVAADDPGIHRLGRMQRNADASVTFGYPGAGFRFRSDARTVAVEAYSTGRDSNMAVRVDGGEPRAVKLGTASREYVLLEQDGNEAHTVEFVHQSETWHGKVTVNNFILGHGKLLGGLETKPRRIVFIGDSVTCGEGAARDGSQACAKNTSWWSAYDSYGWLTGEALDAEVQLVCYGGRGLVRSWNGATGELNGPDFYRLAVAEPDGPRWDQANFPADLVVVSLGTNDLSLAIGPFPEKEPFVEAYVQFVQTIVRDHPFSSVVITDGAIVNDGDAGRPQRTVLRGYLAEVAHRVASDRLYVFESSHFPGDRCDGHPTKPQHAAMSEELVGFIKRNLNW